MMMDSCKWESALNMTQVLDGESIFCREAVLRYPKFFAGIALIRLLFLRNSPVSPRGLTGCVFDWNNFFFLQGRKQNSKGVQFKSPGFNLI